jgi:hypothetical protein
MIDIALGVSVATSDYISRQRLFWKVLISHNPGDEGI